MPPRRLALTLALIAAATACSAPGPATPTSPAGAEAVRPDLWRPTALAGTWKGTYPSGHPITYTFAPTGEGAINPRTGNRAWKYSSTYVIGIPVVDSGSFVTLFETRTGIAYWGSISSGTLVNPRAMRVLGASQPFPVRRQ